MKIKDVLAWLWHRKIRLLIGGLVACVLLSALTGGNTHQVLVSYIYPGAESGLYPDGQRLLRDDLISSDRIEEALAAMREKGWYEDISAKKIQNNLSVREYLSNPVQAKIEALLAEGREYTYYNSEFVVSYSEPTVLHLKDSSDLFGLNRTDRGKEFLEQLIRAAAVAFLENHTEGNIFLDFTKYMQADSTDDYDAMVDVYTDNATLCINYLSKMQEEDSTFVSRTTNLSFADLVTSYQSLLDVQIERLLQYTSAEKVSRLLQERINSYKVDIENNDLEQAKQSDEYETAKTAMLEYDHTFSENIVIVSVNQENGLYQARPKTAYDTVSQQALDAGVNASTAENASAEAARLISEYTASMGSGTNVDSKIATADEMVSAVSAEYERLAQLSASTIVDYIAQTNNNYIKTTPLDDSGISLTKIVKWGIFFVAGMGIAALLCFLFGRRKGKKTINS